MSVLPDTDVEKPKLLPDYGEVIGTHDEKLTSIPSPVDAPVMPPIPVAQPKPVVPLKNSSTPKMPLTKE